MSSFFATNRTSDLPIPARLALIVVLAVGLSLPLVPAPPVRAAAVLYVTPGGSGDCSTWANACTLQTALTTAASGDEIWVAEGTYTPGMDRTATFQLESGVGVYGGFAGTETARGERDWAAHPTVLSGDLNDNGRDDNDAYHVVTGSGTDASAVLDGFTVSGGNADGSSWPDFFGGGMCNVNGSPTLTNVTFSGNSASYGGGMFNDLASHSTLTNVTFSGNSASYGGGMFNESCSPRLTNCILWGNTAPQGAQIYNVLSRTTVTYSDVQGGYPGEGNIDADPLFVDALDDNLRLRVGSPAIDAGDNSAVPAGVTTDLDGNPRITGAAVDMGAYEVGRLYHAFLPLVSGNYTVAPDLIVERVTATGNDVQVVVKNQGNAPVIDEFWVEVYVDPHPAPSAVNDLWYDLCDQGMFWGVVSSALPLAPGEAITLTYGDGYYWPSVSRFDEALPAGTPVYAQVDAYNAATTYGAVRESHEMVGGEYNNVAGPVYSTGAASRRGQPGAETRATGQPRDVSRTNLPPLPGQ